jgi:hypothetical protein
MCVPTSEVGYTSATAGRGDHEVQDEHVVTLDLKQIFFLIELSPVFGMDLFFFF